MVEQKLIWSAMAGRDYGPAPSNLVQGFGAAPIFRAVPSILTGLPHRSGNLLHRWCSRLFLEMITRTRVSAIFLVTAAEETFQERHVRSADHAFRWLGLILAGLLHGMRSLI